MRGPDTALGYFDDPAATAQVFDAAGWGHLGDLGIVDDEGYLRLVGRLKEIINRGGKKISIAEVEAAVVAWEPIREVAAVGYPDDDLGERCAVFVVTDEPEAVTLDGLKAELARREVPKYLWPERLELADSLPLAPSGKVLRDELRRRLVPAVS
jgi:acyl-CoA synthetase (AMP-forming)/AMP-acid ligase II